MWIDCFDEMACFGIKGNEESFDLEKEEGGRGQTGPGAIKNS